MSSSDSDSDENLEALREAVDVTLAANFAPRDAPVLPANMVSERIPSNRPNQRNSVEQTSFDGDLKPEIKNHLAKKLDQMLDSRIKLSKKSKHAKSPVESTDEEDGGVQLFSSSKTIISIDTGVKSEQTRPKVRPKRRKRSGSSNSEDEATKLASATVDANWVLTKRGVYLGDSREADFVVTKNGDCRETQPNAKKSDRWLVNGSSKKLAEEHPPHQHRNACRKKKKKDSRDRVV